MTRHRNQRIWADPNDPDLLQRLADEQENYIGRPYKLELAKGLLTIYCLPKRHKKSPVEKKDRDKRSEKFERRGQ